MLEPLVDSSLAICLTSSRQYFSYMFNLLEVKHIAKVLSTRG
jgi:hypothetical protein